MNNNKKMADGSHLKVFSVAAEMRDKQACLFSPCEMLPVTCVACRRWSLPLDKAHQ